MLFYDSHFTEHSDYLRSCHINTLNLPTYRRTIDGSVRHFITPEGMAGHSLNNKTSISGGEYLLVAPSLYKEQIHRKMTQVLLLINTAGTIRTNYRIRSF